LSPRNTFAEKQIYLSSKTQKPQEKNEIEKSIPRPIKKGSSSVHFVPREIAEKWKSIFNIKNRVKLYEFAQ